MDVQSLLRRLAVEAHAVEGVPRASPFCDFRDFRVTYSILCALAIEVEHELAGIGGAEVEVGALCADLRAALGIVERAALRRGRGCSGPRP